MKNLVCLMFVFLFASASCEEILDDILSVDKVLLFKPIKVDQSFPVVGGVLTLLEVEIEAEQEIPQKDPDSFAIEEVILNEVAVRSLIPGEEDLSDDEILNNIKATRNNIANCDVNQPSLYWIKEMTVLVYNDKHPEPVEIAFYERPEEETLVDRLFPQDICGFKFDVDYGVNLEKYLPRYTLIAKVRGSIPEEPLYIAGLRDITAILGIK